VVIAEHTLPFSANDLDDAPVLLDKAIDLLQGLPPAFTADAAYDAQAVYRYFVGSTTLATPLYIVLNYHVLLRLQQHHRDSLQTALHLLPT
jgi:hypothetical protein